MSDGDRAWSVKWASGGDGEILDPWDGMSEEDEADQVVAWAKGQADRPGFMTPDASQPQAPTTSQQLTPAAPTAPAAPTGPTQIAGMPAVQPQQQIAQLAPLIQSHTTPVSPQRAGVVPEPVPTTLPGATPQEAVARAREGMDADPSLAQPAPATIDARTAEEAIQKALDARGLEVVPVGTAGRAVEEQAPIPAEQPAEEIPPGRAVPPETEEEWLRRYTAAERQGPEPTPPPGDTLEAGVLPPPGTEEEALRRYRMASQATHEGPEDIARYRAQSLDRPMIGVGGAGGEPPPPEEVPAPPPEPVPGVGPSRQVPATAAQRFYRMVSPSAREADRARALDEQRAAQAAGATPVLPDDAPELQVSMLEQERQAKLQALEGAQDGFIGAAIAMAQHRGRVPNSLRVAYRKAKAQYNAAQDDYNNTYNAEVAAIQGVQAARMAAANIDARIAADYAKNIQRRQAEKDREIGIAMRDLDQRRQQIDARINEVREMRVEPQRVFQRMDTGGRLMFAFAAAADGFARGKGVPTQFWDNVNRVIDRDVNAQVEAIGRSHSLIGDEFKAYNLARTNMIDTEARIDQMYAAEFAAAEALAKGMKAKVSGAEQVALLDQVIAQTRRQQAAFQMQAYEKEAQAKLKQIRAAGAGGLKRAKDYMALAKSLNDIIKERKEGGAGAGALAGVEPATLRQILIANRHMPGTQRAFTRLFKMIKREGVPHWIWRMMAQGNWTTALVPKEHVKTYGRVLQAMMDYRRDITGAQAAFKEVEWINQAFAGLGMATSDEEVLDRLNEMYERARNNYETVLSVLPVEAQDELARRMERTRGRVQKQFPRVIPPPE